ncbi:uncharacterized protein NECHADRAFT_55084 [Fusarium vanettenii 77-13-4]|uniref:NACHT domain-containing protein n=1 Tax=Fusarium vanettenii (strain ATCC MYA-4622 / CBS 123669 / FGSC 9596 / NRRL 45880 / 77-13-4) TaxID=660122 RepID=C7ZM97_FUSV7|nr:uncharacterized protein NECHADRAFT_55084 [Fusarium vanettenii 77-13-4]EEU34855.1 hypothetical protein NECHADRAFT_55084 [Fusarium vanettenii 77-13-4]
MAEPVGITLGVLGLLGTFENCVELFAYFSASRSLGRDYEFLEIGLDLEKSSLLQWAERVRLASSDYDKRLDDKTTQDAVLSALTAIRVLLSESSSLQARYGVEIDRGQAKTSALSVSSPVSHRSLNKFQDRVASLKKRMELRQSRTSPVSKIRWVVSDKDKFTELIRELSKFVAKLHHFVPLLSENTSLAGTEPSHGPDGMIREDLRGINEVRKLRLIRDAAGGEHEAVASLADEEVVRMCQRRILRALWFQIMDDRRDMLQKPHHDTFLWALQEGTGGSRWDSIPEWLRSGAGVYWLYGKAGSGKSTLMRYLEKATETKKLLDEWAQERELVIVSFYFWALGTAEQKSQQGLFRALLFHLLSAEPALIPRLLPKSWHAVYDLDSDMFQAPSTAEMKLAFETLSDGVSLQRRFCFFIDGLDEYDGNVPEAIAFIKRLSGNPDLKIIVSSRPLPECVSGFIGAPKLRLQNLTRPDISKFVYDEIGSHPYIQNLIETDGDEAKSILDEIIDRSSGVFLWVALACKSLLRGFDEFDSVDELRERVKALPPELKDMFAHMLSTVENRHKVQAARILRVCYLNHVVKRENARRNWRWVADTGHLSAVAFAIVESKQMDVENLPPQRRLSLAERRRLCTTLEGRLRGRSGGLVELFDGQGLPSSHCLCSPDEHIPDHEGLVDSTVDFLHRTVFEFLDNEAAWSLDYLQTGDPSWNGYAVLCAIASEYAKAIRDLSADSPRYKHEIARSLSLARVADRESPATVAIVLFRLQGILMSHDGDEFPVGVSGQLSSSMTDIPPEIILVLAVEAGIVNFAKTYLAAADIRASETKPPFYPLLFHVLTQFFLEQLKGDSIAYSIPVSADMVGFLLAEGCDPNEEFADPFDTNTTPWKEWMRSLEARVVDICGTLPITEALVSSGSELDAGLAGDVWIGRAGKSIDNILGAEMARLAFHDWPANQKIPGPEVERLQSLWTLIHNRRK